MDPRDEAVHVESVLRGDRGRSAVVDRGGETRMECRIIAGSDGDDGLSRAEERQGLVDRVGPQVLDDTAALPGRSLPLRGVGDPAAARSPAPGRC